MFDKLVESDLDGADLKPRRRIFAASFVFIGVLFATAVVAGIYAADYTLGTENFDIVEMLAPVAVSEPEPEPLRQQRETQSAQSSAETIRRVLMAATDDPSRVPDKISTDTNPYRSVSPDRYKNVKIGTFDSDPSQGLGPERSGAPSGSPSGGRSDEVIDESTTKAPPPPPRIERERRPVSIGVANGKAIDLPKPAYPPSAIAVGAGGAVNVQVTIDEAGKVISAKAVSGHVMLRRVAEQAALRARFTPTTLSKVPVKVTGVIVYNFTR